MDADTVLAELDTPFGHYQVVDTNYGGRQARVLYSGDRLSAQSGVARDGQEDLLFDYNQRFYELVSGVNPSSILIIGGGAFSLPKSLMDEYPNMEIDIVEIDEGLVPIAAKYFDFQPNERVRVRIADGQQYLIESTKKYDVILIDAFTHEVTPQSLQTLDAAASFKRSLNDNGIVAMNIIAAYYGVRSAALRRQAAALQTVFSTTELFPASQGYSLWLPQNFILIAQNAQNDLSQHFRFAQLELPS